MNNRDNYTPGTPDATIVDREGDNWTLALVRDLKHAPEKVWDAISDPEHLKEWAPFDADRRLDTVGNVNLSTVGTPSPVTTETMVTRVVPAQLLEYSWGGNLTRWELEPLGDGTRLKLWAKIDRRYVAMGAAGWHICLDVLDQHLSGTPLGRITGMEALQFEGWQKLHAQYAEAFGVQMPNWGSNS